MKRKLAGNSESASTVSDPAKLTGGATTMLKRAMLPAQKLAKQDKTACCFNRSNWTV